MTYLMVEVAISQRHSVLRRNSNLTEVLVERLTSDFRGDLEAASSLAHSGLDVFVHNIETLKHLRQRSSSRFHSRCCHGLELTSLKDYATRIQILHQSDMAERRGLSWFLSYIGVVHIGTTPIRDEARAFLFCVVHWSCSHW